jgi:hypothetical protein
VDQDTITLDEKFGFEKVTFVGGIQLLDRINMICDPPTLSTINAPELDMAAAW